MTYKDTNSSLKTQEVSPICNKQSMMSHDYLLEPLLIRTSSRGELFLPEPVGGANIPEHAVHKHPHLRSLWGAFTFSKSINVLLNEGHADWGYSRGGCSVWDTLLLGMCECCDSQLCPANNTQALRGIPHSALWLEAAALSSLVLPPSLGSESTSGPWIDMTQNLNLDTFPHISTLLLKIICMLIQRLKNSDRLRAVL